jgi:energy-coupling factor transporter ATP-binding protein EcfA2
MEPHDLRAKIRQLADDLQWLEEYCRKQSDLSQHGGQLRLAAALTRNVIGPALDGQPAVPLFLAVIGGAGAGKSTMINLLAGAVVAEANPQAGYTRHPTAYLPAGADQPWPNSLGFLGPLRRLTGEHPANLDEDVYQIRRIPTIAAESPLAEFVMWDCPDMTTWAASGYVSRLIEVSALADVIIYVASDERYNDEVPTQYLHLLIRAGKAVVICLTKMRESDAAAIADHFRKDVLARITQSTAADIPPIPIVAIPHLSEQERSDPANAAARYRIQLLNQLLVLCPTADAARQRTVRNAVRFLEAAGDGLLAVARKDLAEIEAWKTTVAQGRMVFEERYRHEYLAGEPFRRFDRTREQLLAILDLPAGARYISAVFTILRMPYTFIRDQFGKLVTRPLPPSLPEEQVLTAAMRGWIEGLQAESLRRSGSHPLWRQIAREFEGGLKTRAEGQFSVLARQFELKESDELEQAARSGVEWLVNRPGLLGIIRVGKVTLDLAIIALLLWATWPPNWYHILLIPLAVGLTHQAFELVVRGSVDGVRHRARSKREALLAEQLSGPFAAWLEEQPLAGGSPVQRLRQVLARVPDLIRDVSSAIPPTLPASDRTS